MSDNAENDNKRIQAVQNNVVTLPDGRLGMVTNAYVLGDKMTLYVRVPMSDGRTTTHFWVNEDHTLQS